ncbi:hypothetical protein BD780_000109 [Clostridium tetanomorphum]|uniref:Uncharacterized protein n=1 Tax=Clostridium tetanomorphum TaxID=1553 RepID=A0A923J1A4_CLOTT|nr:hypothetical protein [Clostridium tetanomorphum]KAJ50881.1 hypothetical protein CTM_15598 [Clostridium tetanomorphum DSM 665]KAJ52131.1 hypothetical protein CTM_10181 [Clostridium tetanomorphum DSM 665]MBC2397133.1 hypothetical protein [Clostridium tetanomorphum]MBP1863055.1 hypothetical protein [Clostridium tetanomorphum]NRS82884.1 hypothetical protein [Clostridium tetanomorphum]
MKRKNISKFNFLILLIILMICSLIRYRIICYKSKEITYVVERYLTTGIFNTNKLYGINNFHLSFSDGKVAVVKVNGLQKKSPHKKINYNIFLEKNSKGIWKVKKLYQVP